MLVYVLYIVLMLFILWLIFSGKEGYWYMYNMPTGIPKTYISPHFILNTPCLQPANPVAFYDGKTNQKVNCAKPNVKYISEATTNEDSSPKKEN